MDTNESIVMANTGVHPDRRGCYCVTFGTSAANRQRITQAMAGAKNAPLRELETVRAAFFAEGPGRAVREMEKRIEDAKAAIRSAEAELAQAGESWSAAVAGGTDTTAHDEARRTGRDRLADRKERLHILVAELPKVKAEAVSGLRAAIDARLAELDSVHSAGDRLAAAKERMAQSLAEPFTELMIAQAEADGVGSVRFDKRYAALFAVE